MHRLAKTDYQAAKWNKSFRTSTHIGGITTSESTRCYGLYVVSQTAIISIWSDTLRRFNLTLHRYKIHSTITGTIHGFQSLSNRNCNRKRLKTINIRTVFSVLSRYKFVKRNISNTGILVSIHGIAAYVANQNRCTKSAIPPSRKKRRLETNH